MVFFSIDATIGERAGTRRKMPGNLLEFQSLPRVKQQNVKRWPGVAGPRFIAATRVRFATNENITQSMAWTVVDPSPAICLFPRKIFH